MYYSFFIKRKLALGAVYRKGNHEMAISMLNSTILFTVMGVICQMRKLLQAETEDWMKVAKKNISTL